MMNDERKESGGRPSSFLVNHSSFIIPPSHNVIDKSSANVSIIKPRGIDRGESWGVCFNDGPGDGRVSSLESDGCFDYENPLPAGLDAQTRELAQAERRMPERIEHKQISTLDLHQGGLAHKVCAPAAVARL
jgi:hypothetical protein